jgi:Tol biopolymer transport system component
LHDSIAARLVVVFAMCAGCWAACTSPATAAGPPLITSTWVEGVSATAASLNAQIDPNGFDAKYVFEYLTDAKFQANPPADRFAGAVQTPATGFTSIIAPGRVVRGIHELSPTTVYHYRAVAKNAAGETLGPARTLTTELATNQPPVLDNRAYELVSPIDKNGGSIQGAEESFGGGVFQAAAGGDTLTYSSAASFGSDPAGAPPANQYLARRSATGWSAENITTPLLSGSYGDRPEGVPYQLFSGDLARGLLSNGRRCRGSDGECPVANPPLPGSGAPAGYENYYLRDTGTASFRALLGAPDLAGLALGPEQFELSFAGASPDLTHVVVSSCAALAPGATEVPAAGGCDPAFQNLYAWSEGGLSLVNVVPVDAGEAEGAALAAQGGAVSSDGSRIYWTVNGDLYLSEGAQAKPVGAGGARFETASSDGSVAFFTETVAGAAHLFRYDADTATATDLTPGGQVLGVLGASADGSHVYFQTAAGLELWNAGVTVEVAPGSAAAAASSYPPATGTARVTPDGAHLAFVSVAELTGYENADYQEAFVYGPPPGGGAPTLSCASCNPTGEQPTGGASIPGAIANGSDPAATRVYKPRALSDDGSRVFFESSDRLSSKDDGGVPDVYEWEARGAGSCTLPGGCIGLVSTGRSSEPSSFVDASANGHDVFFLTVRSLVAWDPGSYDIYDFRENGSLPGPEEVFNCNGDACQSLPQPPDDPTPGTLVPNGGNPALRFPKQHGKRKHHKKKHGHGKRGGKTGHQRGGGR